MFADELKAQREAAGLTQDQLAKLMNYSPSVIAKLETCRVIPSEQHAEHADQALRMPGTFVRLRRAIVNGHTPPWFRPYLDVEQRATVIRSWQPLVVDGLLQTEGYARAIIRAANPGGSPERVASLVAARMERRRIWDREEPEPPLLSVILGEAALRQRTGGRDVMREQLERLAEASEEPKITVQIMPFSAEAHPGMLGPFVVASFADDSDVAYLDNALNGQSSERRREVSWVGILFDTLRSEALSPRESRDLIMKVVQEWT